MSKKKEQPKEAEQEVRQEARENEFGFVITVAGGQDCVPYDKVEEVLKSHHELEEAAEKLLKSKDEVIKAQEDVIRVQAEIIEKHRVAWDFYIACLNWAENHMGFFTRRKYEKIFNKTSLFKLIRERKYRNMEEGNELEAQVDEEMMQTL